MYIAELKRFVKGGYSIAESLMAATITNAKLLDMDDKLGSLEPASSRTLSWWTDGPTRTSSIGALVRFDCGRIG
ncbi:MAG: hypothetical protein K2Y23_14565 [Cyanobacteria bacterium]|nr:hypothetical protein [Cyanobacteriota bacterium]